MVRAVKGIPETAQVDKDAIPFENYRALAGAVVARAVEDFVIVHIFYRDDALGRFDYIYQKTAVIAWQAICPKASC